MNDILKLSLLEFKSIAILYERSEVLENCVAESKKKAVFQISKLQVPMRKLPLPQLPKKPVEQTTPQKTQMGTSNRLEKMPKTNSKTKRTTKKITKKISDTNFNY